jgi:uncharacterized linocin/CFP29 family protein
VNDGNDQVGWTDAQWNRVRDEVLQAWQRVRVAGSFLPVYGPLPPSTQIVPSEVFNLDGTIDDQGTASLLEVALPVALSRQQIREEDLASALLQFRRRAAQVGQLEDWYIFNGTFPPGGYEAPAPKAVAPGDKILPSYRPHISFLENLIPAEYPVVSGEPTGIADPVTQVRGLRLRNPGALGVIEGSGDIGSEPPKDVRRYQLDERGLMEGVVEAITSLEEAGFVPPYACVFGRDPFVAAHKTVHGSTSAPRDRLEPLIGRELLHASAIDVPPSTSPDIRSSWQRRGVLLSLADYAVDLVIAAEATPEFRRVNERGRYVFVVFERFALRIKDRRAIVRLYFGS